MSPEKIPPKKSKHWMKLDNAAVIYPAARRRGWTALFRVSAELTEPIDPEILAAAQKSTLRRFPGFKVRLRHGLFWYYFEHLSGMPEVQQDVGNPLVRMKLTENGGFMFRVRYYNNRIALEVFHVLSDGTGGMAFLKTLVAEYLRLKYGAQIPRDDTILECGVEPGPEETEDAFLRYARDATRSGKEPTAYQIKGTDEPNDVIHITTGIIPAAAVLEKAKALECTLTEYLVSILLLSADAIQRAGHIPQRLYRPVKVNVPVNLRKFYGNTTLRNFSSYVNPGIEPRLGRYTLEETVRAVSGYMALETTEKMLNAKFSGNVKIEKNKALRVAPLFIKKYAMKIGFFLVGDRQYTSSFSNLGRVTLPPEMAAYVTRLDFILGPLNSTRVVSAGATYNGQLVINFTRTIAEPTLERSFFTSLVKQGIPVRIESNQR